MSRNDRYHYRVCGLGLESNAPFSIAEDALLDGEVPDIKFTLKSPDAPTDHLCPSGAPATFIKNGAGYPSIAVYPVGELFRLECVNSKTNVAFLLPRDGGWVECYPRLETTVDEIELWLFGLVMSFILQGRGIFALHAAAVDGNGRAIAFLGANGYGKSTLALYFANKGHALITDDVLPVVEKDGCLRARRGSPSINLWRQSLDQLGSARQLSSTRALAAGKRRYDLADLELRRCDSEIPLQTIYFLEPANPAGTEPVRIEIVSRAQALIDLLVYTRANSTIDLPAQKQLIAFYTRLLAQVSVRRLIYPRGFEHLPAIYQAVLQDNP